jgi:hypothetical protein
MDIKWLSPSEKYSAKSTANIIQAGARPEILACYWTGNSF